MSEPQHPIPQTVRRAVIIDDQPAVCEVLSKMLISLGYVVTIATDSRSSYIFDREDSDINFLDVVMPISSGLKVIEQLARQKSKCAIVLMSGDFERLNEAESYVVSLDLNLITALEKPFKLQDIKFILQSA